MNLTAVIITIGAFAIVGALFGYIWHLLGDADDDI